MDALLQDLRIALRSLLRRPAFLLGAVVTLGLGVGAATSMFSVVNGVLLRPPPYPEPERLVRIWQTSRDAPAPAYAAGGSVSPVSLADWQERAGSFAALALYTESSATVTSFDEAEVMRVAQVTQEFFRVLGRDLALGRGFEADELRQGGPRAVVISWGLWQERFGGRPDVTAHSLDLEGTSWPIVGVAAPGLDFPGAARIWFPLRPDPACGRTCIYTQGLGRLAPGVTLEQAQQEMRAVALALEEAFPDAHRGRTLAVATLQDSQVGGVRTALWLLLGSVMLVVLIACANVANLLLVRGAQRTGELAVRAALGAQRSRLVRQILTESMVIAALGGALGLLLAAWGVALLPALAMENLPRAETIAIDLRVAGFAVALVAFTSLLFGLAPALHLSRAPLSGTLRRGGRGSAHSPVRRTGRFLLLAGEVGLSLMLLLGAGLLLRSFERLHALPLGFDDRAVAHFTVALPDARYPTEEDAVLFFEAMRQRLAALPGVQQATFISGAPLGPTLIGSTFTRTDAPPPEPGLSPTARLSVAGPAYFATLGIPLLRGRSFEEGDVRGGMPVAIVSRAAADQYWPGVDPIGRQIQVAIALGYPEDAPRTIVGIVDDVRAVELRADPRPEIYLPHAQSAAYFATFMLRTRGNEGSVLAAARQELRARDPLLPMMQPGTLRELVDAHRADTRFYTVVLSLFAALAVALAALGVYSVVAFLVARRTREMGVRLALGARPAALMREVLVQGLAPAAVGIVIGIGGALAASRVLGAVLFETATFEPVTWAAAAAIIVAVVAIACVVPARRAAAVPPSIALREE